MSQYIQSNQVIILPYLDLDITNAESGKLFITPQTAGAVDVTYTLPPPESGLHFRFINGAPAALAGSVIIATDGAATILYGRALMGPNDGVSLLEISAKSQIHFVSLLGDFIDIISDGTFYYVDGNSCIRNCHFVCRKNSQYC